MKKNASAILLIVAIFVVLVALNFIFFVDTSAAEEDEQNGDRSSNRATPYGTLAYYTLLKESGYPLTQFEQPLTELKPGDIGTLIVIAPPVTNNPSQDELNSLNNWVEAGGLLIIIDRDIRVTFGDTAVNTQQAYSKAIVRPLQPTAYTRGVERISLSEYATRVKLENREATAHVGDYQGAVVADLKFGDGRVVILTDPYIVANNGIREADNAVLAVNLLAERPEGKVAFDEYHHGYGIRPARGQSLMTYFQGTPIPWMVWQGVLIAALVIYTYSRRFGRPVPLKRERRTTNLEFVSSMANITRLARASDLAMQNVYGEFRKRLSRFTSLPVDTPTERLATAVARRAKTDEKDMIWLLSECEQVAKGKPVADTDLLRLVARIREVESRLGI